MGEATLSAWLPRRRPVQIRPPQPEAPAPTSERREREPMPTVDWIAPRCPRCESDLYRVRGRYPLKRKLYLACRSCGCHYIAQEVGGLRAGKKNRGPQEPPAIRPR